MPISGAMKRQPVYVAGTVPPGKFTCQSGYGGLRRGIEGVHAVVFRGDEDDVVRAFAGHRHTRHEQRLRIHVPIDRERKDFAELAGIHIGGSQGGFVERGAGARIVILRGEHLPGGERGKPPEGAQALKCHARPPPSHRRRARPG